MQAMILAAGYGRRLRPLTDEIPKALVEVNGVPLLINALNHLANRAISEVILVVGDKKHLIMERIGHSFKGMQLIYVENPLYRETNNVYSFWLARPYVHDDMLMFECDLFYRRSLVDSVLSGSTGAGCGILVSPYDASRMDGTVILADGIRAQSLVIKSAQGPSFDYAQALKTVNVYAFQKDFICNRLMPMAEAYVKTQGVNSYYELVLGSLIYFGNHDIRVVSIAASEWAEIDTLDDLKIAERRFPREP